MDEKYRQSGFKALLESHKANSHHLEETDGSLRLWRDLSAEGKLEYMARDAAWYDVPFEQFAQVVRESVDNAAIEEAALRLAFRSRRELHDLENLFPDDGRTDSPPPLVERVSELLNANSPEHEDEEVLTCEKLAALFKEVRADEATAKREDAHWYGMEALEAYQKILDGKMKAPAAEKAKGIERSRGWHNDSKRDSRTARNCPGLVYSLCHAGIIRHTRVGMPGERGAIRITEEAIAEYLRAREVGPAAPRPTTPPRPKVKLHHLQLPS